MKKNLLSLGLLFTAFCLQASPNTSYKVLEGTIDGKYEIELHLNIEESDEECAKVEGWYQYKSTLTPIELKGEVCNETNFTLHYYDQNQKIAETFSLEADLLSARAMAFVGTWKRGSKALDVDLQNVVMKYGMLESLDFFDDFVNTQTDELKQTYAWGGLETPIYSSENLYEPTTAAKEARGPHGAYIVNYYPGYLSLDAVSLGMGRGISEDVLLFIAPDVFETPTYVEVTFISGGYTEDMMSNDPKMINLAELYIDLYQEQDGKLVEVTQKLAGQTLKLDKVKKIDKAFNFIAITFEDGSKQRWVFESGKLVKK